MEIFYTTEGFNRKIHIRRGSENEFKYESL